MALSAAERQASYRARHPGRIVAYKHSQARRDSDERYRTEKRDSVRAAWMKYRSGPKYRATYLNNHLKRSYGITLDEYNSLLESQGGVCKICGGKDSRVWKDGRKQLAPLCVDHNHISGKVRGLLCNKCNVAIALAKDSVDILASAIRYLTESMKEV